MNIKRKCQVVMLITNEEVNTSVINLDNDNELIHINQYIPKLKHGNQHLYITSDEEMKKGDYVYVACSEVNVYGIRQITEYYNGQFLFDDKSQIDMDYCKKIIATTDTSLKIHHFNKGVFKNLEYLLPHPSQEFIETYVKTYNEGNPITEVIVEYEIICGRCYSNTDECWSAKECSRKTDFPDIVKLKVNSDKTINIKPIKDSWSREEVKQLLNKFSIDCFKIAKESVIWGEDYPQIVSDKWIENNL